MLAKLEHVDADDLASITARAGVLAQLAPLRQKLDAAMQKAGLKPSAEGVEDPGPSAVVIDVD